MATPADLALFRAERDALAFLGVISSLHLRFDPPIVAPNIEQPQPTHFHGLNVHALMIDNVDGEVLALEQNQIHAHQSPVEHGEQRALRTAIARVGQKRPRAAATTVEEYYRSQLFYGNGEKEIDYLKQGATIYTSLEPCPMCATTILVCRVKRTVFLLQDKKFGGAWTTIKDKFYPDNKLTYGQLDLSHAKSPLIRRAHNINKAIGRKVDALRKKKVPDTLFFDHVADDLRGGFRFLCGVTDRDLATKGEHKSANARTLRDLKRFCNIPSAS